MDNVPKEKRTAHSPEIRQTFTIYRLRLSKIMSCRVDTLQHSSKHLMWRNVTCNEAIPKSATLILCFSSSKRFSGFRSRWLQKKKLEPLFKTSAFCEITNKDNLCTNILQNNDSFKCFYSPIRLKERDDKNNERLEYYSCRERNRAWKQVVQYIFRYRGHYRQWRKCPWRKLLFLMCQCLPGLQNREFLPR